MFHHVCVKKNAEIGNENDVTVDFKLVFMLSSFSYLGREEERRNTSNRSV